MIAVDTSALVAIANEEVEADTFLSVLQRNDGRVAPVNYLETGIVLISRGSLDDQAALDAWFSRLKVEIYAAEPLHSRALAAYLRFGKGFHPARLNMGDCFAFALAEALAAPLLFKGDDFARTTIRPAFHPT